MPTAPPLPVRATYRDVFRGRGMRVLLGSRTLAVAADTLRIVALSVLVFDTTRSPLLAAVAFGIGFLPQAAGGVLLGALSDRLPPRPLISAGYALECGTALALALLPLPVWSALLLVAAVACLTPVFAGASGRLTAAALHGDAYVLGRALLSMSGSAAQLVGLAAAGAAVAAVGARHALLITAGCHAIASVWARLGLPGSSRSGSSRSGSSRSGSSRSGTSSSGTSSPAPPVPAPPDPGAPRTVRTATGMPAPRRGRCALLAQSWSGTRILLAAGPARTLLIAQWLPPTFTVGAEALIIPYARTQGWGPGVLGLLLAAPPIGMLIGDLVVGRLIPPRGRERLVSPLLLLLALPLLAFAATPAAALSGILLGTSAVGYSYTLGLQRPFRAAIPEQAQGHGFSLLSTGMMTGQGIGPVLTGALAALTTTPLAMAAAGLAAAATALALHSPLRRLTGGKRPPHVHPAFTRGTDPRRPSLLASWPSARAAHVQEEPRP